MQQIKASALAAGHNHWAAHPSLPWDRASGAAPGSCCKAQLQTCDGISRPQQSFRRGGGVQRVTKHRHARTGAERPCSMLDNIVRPAWLLRQPRAAISFQTTALQQQIGHPRQHGGMPQHQMQPAAKASAAAAAAEIAKDSTLTTSRTDDTASEAMPPSEHTAATSAQSEVEEEGQEAGDADDDDLLFAQLQRLQLRFSSSGDEERERVLPSLDLRGVAEHIEWGRARKIVVLCGAGISTSAGIPDFRSPRTGLYDQLEKFNLPDPQSLFEISFFKRNPQPFNVLAKELFPGNFRPTPAHYFMRLLHEKGLLLRVFTQNIDSLEKQAGLPPDAIVAAHGNFDSAHCLDCSTEFTTEYVRTAVFADEICTCSQCGGLVKPRIVFFGESLPARFFRRMVDLKAADLLIVMGTSLVVQPFASLIDEVHPDCPRLLINREKVGVADAWSIEGFLFEREAQNYRDVLFLGDADDGVSELCELLGWGQELQALVE